MVTNAAKTKCLLVTGKRIPCKLDNRSLELKLANSDIEQVDSQKLLGVTIDKHLRAILCKNQAKWEMKNFDLPSNFACN